MSLSIVCVVCGTSIAKCGNTIEASGVMHRLGMILVFTVKYVLGVDALIIPLGEFGNHSGVTLRSCLHHVLNIDARAILCKVQAW